VAPDQSIPASAPKSDKVTSEKPVQQYAAAPQPAAVRISRSSFTLAADIRHESPPPRILYCVWRI
jgi:hypothetical protein